MSDQMTEVERLRAENAKLRAENARLRSQLTEAKEERRAANRAEHRKTRVGARYSAAMLAEQQHYRPGL